jgi:hypothetical protein
LMHGLQPDRRLSLWTQARETGGADVLSALLLASPFESSTWAFVDALPAETRADYWRDVTPGAFLGEDEEMRYVVDRFIDAGRHRTAFHALQFHPERVGSDQLVAILEGIRGGAEPNGGALDGWRIKKALECLANDASFPRRQLAVLEFHYFDALRHDHQRRARTLSAEMSADPALFMEVVMLAVPEKPDEMHASTRTHAWSVLHNSRGMPGMKADGTVDHRVFFDWVNGVRAIAKEHDRADAAGSMIGTLLTKCPTEPGTAVRRLLEDPDSERVRNGFVIGVLNNRGVHSRAVGAGGSQERSLAEQFRDSASRMAGAFPRTAETLDAIARSYDRDAKWHDTDAALWKEGTR